jgi:hypothetical protein
MEGVVGVAVDWVGAGLVAGCFFDCAQPVVAVARSETARMKANERLRMNVLGGSWNRLHGSTESRAGLSCWKVKSAPAD